MKTSVANAIILSLCVGSGVHSFTPAEPPKRMKSDFADFVTRSAYGPQYTSQAKAGGTSSILMPSGNSTEFRNFYDVLGVDRDDEFKDIKRVYRKKAKEYHPGELLGKMSLSSSSFVFWCVSGCLHFAPLFVVCKRRPEPW